MILWVLKKIKRKQKYHDELDEKPFAQIASSPWFFVSPD